MTRLNGHYSQIVEEAIAMCGGIDDTRTRLVAIAMHAHISNLDPRGGWPRNMIWHEKMARSAVRSADAVIEAMESA